MTSAACAGPQAPTRLRVEPTAWSLPLVDADGAWTPSLVDGDVFLIGTRTDADAIEVSEPAISIARVDTTDGTLRWDTALRAGSGATEIQSADNVVVVQQGSAVEAVTRGDGRYLWGVRYAESPELVGVGGGTVAVVLADGILNARDSRSGAHRFTIDVSPYVIERFVQHQGRLYALGVYSTGGGARVGVFDAATPSSAPLWNRSLDGSLASIGYEDGVLVGRIGGVRDAALRLGDGSYVFEDDEPRYGGEWIGRRYIRTEALEGVVLRLRRLQAFGADDDEALWQHTVATSSDVAVTPVALPSPALLAASTTTAELIDAATGTPLWTVAVERWDDDGRACTITGALPHALLRHCTRLGDSRLVAVEVEPN